MRDEIADVTPVLWLSKIVDQTSYQFACQRPSVLVSQAAGPCKVVVGHLDKVMPSDDASGGPCILSPARIEYYPGQLGIAN